MKNDQEIYVPKETLPCTYHKVCERCGEAIDPRRRSGDVGDPERGRWYYRKPYEEQKTLYEAALLGLGMFCGAECLREWGTQVTIHVFGCAVTTEELGRLLEKTANEALNEVVRWLRREYRHIGHVRVVELGQALKRMSDSERTVMPRRTERILGTL